VLESVKDDAVTNENSQKLMKNTNISNYELNLRFIKVNSGNLPKYITILETSGLSLADAFNVMAQVQNYIRTVGQILVVSESPLTLKSKKYKVNPVIFYE